MFEKLAAIVLCAMVLFGCFAIIWITWRGYDRVVNRSKTEKGPGLASGPVRRPSRKQVKKRRGRR